MSDPLRPPAAGLPGRTLVLGAGGFLGSQAALWLARAGCRLRLFDLSVASIPRAVRERSDVEIVHGNLLDDVVVRRALDGVDQVLHFVSATVPSTSVADVGLELSANVLPTVRLLEAMRSAGTPLVIFPSSGGTIYGDEAPRAGFPESAPARPQGSYGLGKLLAEEILTFQARSGGPHCLIVRISNAYGPSVHSHHRQGVINAFLESVRAGAPVRVWGDGSAVRDYVHVEDILAAISSLVACGASDEIYNVGSGEGHSVADILDVVRRVTGREVRIERVAGEYTGVRRSILDVSKLRTRTGWTPQVTIEEGISHLWRSLHAQQ